MVLLIHAIHGKVCEFYDLTKDMTHPSGYAGDEFGAELKLKRLIKDINGLMV